MSAKLLFVLLLLSALFVQSVGMADSTRLYRCEGANGQIEFRQDRCHDGRQQEIEIEDVKMGWDAPVYKVEVKKRKSASKTRRAAKSRAKKDEKCFKTRQRLESLNRKMRRGYKAGKGADLRHRRRQYEEYLDRFC